MFVFDRAIYFFTGWGIRFGASLGLLTGTLIFPVIGSGYSFVWGFGVGLVLGLVTGVLAGVASLLNRQPEGPRRRLRRWLTGVIGLLTALAAPALVLATSRDLLWNWRFDNVWDEAAGGWVYVPFFNVLTPYLVPVLAAALMWGGLAAAYTTQRYMDYQARLAARQHPDERNGNPILYDIENDTLTHWREAFFNHYWPVIPLVGLIASYVTPHAYVYGTLIGLAYGALALLMIALCNAMLLIFLNRILFTEYLPGLTLRAYQRAIGAVTALFTVIIGAMMTVGHLAPLAGPMLSNPITQQALVAAVLVTVLMGIGSWRTALTYGAWYDERWTDWAEREISHRLWLIQHQPDGETERDEADLLADMFDGAHLAKRLDTPRG